jgi:hypothetical protein
MSKIRASRLVCLWTGFSTMWLATLRHPALPVSDERWGQARGKKCCRASVDFLPPNMSSRPVDHNTSKRGALARQLDDHVDCSDYECALESFVFSSLKGIS